MIRRFGRHLGDNLVAYFALTIALSGTSAYAINTIGSSDVIDNSLQSADIKNYSVDLQGRPQGGLSGLDLQDRGGHYAEACI